MTARANMPESGTDMLDYRLSLRLGPAHARQRLNMEQHKENRILGEDHHAFHLENIYSAPGFIRTCLQLAGLWRRGQHNSRQLRLVQQTFTLSGLPRAFDGYRILHLSDLHVDMDAANLQALMDRIAPLDYDLCVLTGDYRSLTYGPIENALTGMKTLRSVIKGEPVGVLGNHDSIRMLPALEDMGYRMLLNEQLSIERDGARLHLAGVDDAHFYKAHNLHKAGDDIPTNATSILLSHTPEIWLEAAHAGFDLFLCGHTHGGQICLPGGIPVTLDADCPRALGRGYWQRHGMQGYTSPGSGTSVVNVRLNCPPEVTLHTLHCTA